MSKQDFQILAIRIGANNDKNALKNLKENTVYKFDNRYEYINNDFLNIKYNPEDEISLYELNIGNGSKIIPVNISTIVGKNGSGKSALIELFYLMNYNLSCHLKLINDIPCQIDIELFYKNSNGYSILHVNKESSRIKNFIELFEINKVKQNDLDKSFLTDIFYSIVVNYSIYALNSIEIGDWIINLFHKNDGYQTPIVINPYREKGNIDINKEKKLLYRRLQANLLEQIGDNEKDSIRNLSNGNIAKYFFIKFNNNYFADKKINDVFNNNHKKLKIIIEELYGFYIKPCDFSSKILIYIYAKLHKMVEYYYYKYQDYIFNGEGGWNISDYNGLLKMIKEEHSHSAFKVKGAIMHLKYYNDIYNECIMDGSININPLDLDGYNVDIEKYSKVILDIKEKDDSFINTFIMTFPSFFDVDVILSNNISIKDLSSGEKQKINSLSSIIYHIININSVETSVKYNKYKYINIILDEIELYYHPEWQRNYINELLNYLNKINIDDIKYIEGVNIIFVTHSPFILSDITSHKILILNDGEPDDYLKISDSFGANIYDILQQGFFFDKGYIGEFVVSKIKYVIDIINKAKQKNITDEEYDKVKTIINLIGEPLIKRKLTMMLNDVYDKDKEQTVYR